MKTFVLAVGICLLGLSGCGEEKPDCLTKNAVRDKDGVCGCPPGTHIEVSTCVDDDASVDIAPSSTTDGKVEQPKRPDSGTKQSAPDSGVVADAGDDPFSPLPAEDGGGDPASMVTDAATSEISDASVAPEAPDAGPAPIACMPVPELCDRMDNDCDGQIDNGSDVKNECGACGKLAHAKGETCSNGGQGPCAKPGVYVCMGETTVCNAPSTSPSAEVCDNVDNDCDGMVDDGITKNGCMGCAPLAHTVKSACSDGVGECKVTGTWDCMGTEAVACTAKAKAPAAEVCDKKDNDCDGMVDEGFVTGGSCTAGLGECLATGTLACNAAGAVACSVVPKAASTAEKCDQKDNDCDGQTDEDGVCTPPVAASTVVQLSARGNQTCARLSDGTVKCWGGDVAKVSRPTTVAGLTQVAEVATGANHACARLTTGTVSCWGTNGHGQVGDGTRTNRAAPVAVAGLAGVEQVAAGDQHTCARLGDGLIRCWGAGNAGQLGDEGTGDSISPKATTAFGSSATQDLRLGSLNTCVRLNESGWPLICAGDNTSGQTRGSSQMFDADQFSIGDDHLCARKPTGEAFCWGSDYFGKVGSGNGAVLTAPQPVPGVNGVVEVLAGGGLTCARVTSGAVYCWGANESGQIGIGTTSSTVGVAPTQVPGITATQVVVGAAHACAQLASGSVSCWGDNKFGQLGLGDLSVGSRASPTAVVALP